MKKLFKKETLFIRVAIGFALGIILGLVAPQFSIATKVVGDVYLNLIKLMIIPSLSVLYSAASQTFRTARFSERSASAPFCFTC